MQENQQSYKNLEHNEMLKHIIESQKTLSNVKGDLDDFIFFGEEIKPCSER